MTGIHGDWGNGAGAQLQLSMFAADSGKSAVEVVVVHYERMMMTNAAMLM